MSELTRPILSVVIPCYNEEDSIPTLVAGVSTTLESVTHGDWELLLVDDGSVDRTAQLIRDAARQDPRVRGVILSRNFGHQPAIFTGLSYVSGDYIAVMDADLQDPPEVLVECMQKIRQGDYDLICAVRQRRKGAWPLRLCYWAFYRIMNALAESAWPLDTGDFSVMNRKALSLLLQMPEHVRILRGLRSWIGLKQGFVPYDRPERKRGASKYSIIKLAALASNALISFSNVPLRMATFLGVGMSVASAGLGVLFLLNRLFPTFSIFGYHVGANPGTTTIVMLLLLIGSLLFLCLGIMGEYLGVIVKEVKRRPLAIVQEQHGLKRARPRSNLILVARQSDEP
jgi:glycosyltransferase involved in cell wall biosynthesis